MAKERVIVGIDMGSHRMTAVIGVLDEDEVLEIAGVGSCPLLRACEAGQW
jgi:cell division ATPase FtsA